MELPMPSEPQNNPTDSDAEDCYIEDGLLVFTAAYHLKRGYCCGSGCRHCPYPSQPAPCEPQPTKLAPSARLDSRE